MKDPDKLALDIMPVLLKVGAGFFKDGADNMCVKMVVQMSCVGVSCEFMALVP